jgi:hypothetical protein
MKGKPLISFKQIAFSDGGRKEFEKTVLFPLAGINPDLAEKYHQVMELATKLDHAGNLVAKRYLDQEIDADKALQLLNEYPFPSDF